MHPIAILFCQAKIIIKWDASEGSRVRKIDAPFRKEVKCFSELSSAQTAVRFMPSNVSYIFVCNERSKWPELMGNETVIIGNVTIRAIAAVPAVFAIVFILQTLFLFIFWIYMKRKWWGLFSTSSLFFVYWARSGKGYDLFTAQLWNEQRLAI